MSIQTYAGLTITGTVGVVYSIDYATDLTQTNRASAWRCLEYLQLPASPYLWADKSAPATAKRFHRTVAMDAPTNVVFIPPGTFRMGSPTNEVERQYWEGPQTDLIISRGFWMGNYEVTQGEYLAVMGNNPNWFPPANATAPPAAAPPIVPSTPPPVIRLPTAAPAPAPMAVPLASGDQDAQAPSARVEAVRRLAISRLNMVFLRGLVT